LKKREDEVRFMMKAIDLHPNEEPPITAKPEEQFKLAN
jgi:hypothetical protein